MLLVMMLLMMMPDMAVVITTDNDYTDFDDELDMIYVFFFGHNTEIRIQALTPLGIRKRSSPRSYTQGCQGYAS